MFVIFSQRVGVHSPADCTNSYTSAWSKVKASVKGEHVTCVIVPFLINTSTLCKGKELYFGKISTFRQVDGIIAVHEFHIWQLAGNRIIASAHITCHNLRDYMRVAEEVKTFFHNEGIHSTTIQPEFIEVGHVSVTCFSLFLSFRFLLLFLDYKS